MKTHVGHSLAELLVCLFVLTTLASVALPEWTDLLRRERQRANVNQMLNAINYTRTQSVRNQAVVTLCSGQQKCNDKTTWHTQLLAFTDNNRNGRIDSGETLLRIFPLPPDSSWQWQSFRQKPYLQFEGNGTTFALNGTLSLCYFGKVEHQIVINLTGRARISEQPGTACDH